MTGTDQRPVELRTRAEAEAYVASICFKHGPPRLVGAELEWTVHHAEDPAAVLDPARLAEALGRHAPRTLVPESPAEPMLAGCAVTVEPGGQVELSAPPTESSARLLAALAEDTKRLTERCHTAGLRLGEYGIDHHRGARRLLRTPRYAAMEAEFTRFGVDGLSMMCRTAGVQVCVDMGEPERAASRWAAAHALGPVLCALFGNTAPGSSWVSERQRVVFGSDPIRMRPAEVTPDPAKAWARRVLEAPVICVRSLGGCWTPPRAMSFDDWLRGALEPAPTTADLAYHLSTMFPPVRPQGYIELRYVDAQAGSDWFAPLLLLTALLGGEGYTDRVLAAARPAEGRWLAAAREGLADPAVARAASAVVALGVEAIERTDVAPETATRAIETLYQRLRTPLAA